MNTKQAVKCKLLNALRLQWLRDANQLALRCALDLKHVYHESKYIFPENRIINIGKRILAVIWCLPYLHRASMWLDSVENPLLAKEFLNTPELRSIIFRPYVSRNWNATKRMEVIAEHYNLVCKNAAILNLAPDEYIDLAAFDFKCGNLRVVLDKPSWFRREGEIGLSLFLGIHRIYTVMFLLSGSSAHMSLIIGCVQGGNTNLRWNPYRELTKELHGMRPRDFILNITKIFSEEFCCEEILGVSDFAHRGKVWYSKANKIAGYNEIWLEHGGKKVSNDFYSLPPKILKRMDKDIKQQKRGMYRKRYQFLDELQLVLQDVIATPPQKKFHQYEKIRD